MSEFVQFQVLLSARSPLLIGTGVAVGNVQTSRLFVPGSVWRGAVARHILDGLGVRRYAMRPVANDHLPSAFHDLFSGDEAARFSTLYPVRVKPSRAGTVTTFMIPASARKRKYGRQTAFDGMLTRAQEHLENLSPYSRAKKMDDIKDRWDKMRGPIRRINPTIAQEYGTREFRTRSFVRVGLNRKTETAADGALYVLDALVPSPNKPITFVGNWYGTEKQAHAFEQFLQAHFLPGNEGGYLMEVGTARARGMGECELILCPAPTFPSVTDRVNAFNRSLGGEVLYFTLTLRSPLLLIDEYGQSATTLTDYLLQTYIPDLPKTTKILEQYSVLESETWAGWSGAWGLPKPVTTTLSAGSVLLLCIPRGQLSELIQILTRIERTGLGERRGEGWGEILACDPFHVTFWEHRT